MKNVPVDYLCAMNMKHLVFSLCLSVSFACVAAAETGEILHLDRSSGLSNNNITAFAQDGEGYVWVATESGLNRFDGSMFRSFKKADSGLSDNALNRLYADTDEKKLWIATQRAGLDVLDLDTYRISSYCHDDKNPASICSDAVTSVCRAGNDGLWIATYTDGLDYLDKKTGKFTHYNKSTVKNWPDNKLWDAMPDRMGNIYIAHVNSGLTVFNPQTHKIENYRYNPNDPNSIPSDEVRRIHIDGNHNIWVGTDSGLALFLPDEKRFVTFRHDSRPESLLSNKIRDISRTGNGFLVVATENGGLSLLPLSSVNTDSPESANFINYSMQRSDNYQLSNKTVNSAFYDSFGNIWAGTYGDGIDILSAGRSSASIYDTGSQPFGISYNPVMSICAYGDTLWVGNDGKGVDLLDKNGRIASFRNLGDNAVLAMLRSRDGSVWFGTYGGKVFRYRKGMAGPANVDIPGLRDVRCFAEDSKGDILIGHQKGIVKISSDGNVLKNLDSSSMPGGGNVRSIDIDRKGRIWAGFFGDGITLYSPDLVPVSKKTIRNGLPSNMINHILPAADGSRWLATSEGLVKLSPSMEIDTVYNKNSGLIDNFVEALIKDADGNIWMSTMGGISMLDTSGKIHNYLVGRQYGRLDYNTGAVGTDLGGKIYFGSHYGVLSFMPEALMSPQEIAAPKITAISVLGSPADGDDTRFSPSGELKLNHKQNTLRIWFDMLDPVISAETYYEYKLEGLDKQWIRTPEGSNQAVIGNIPPGSYELLVRAVSQEGSIRSDITRLRIVVAPPLWATWWAKTLYALLAAALGVFLLLLWRRRIKAEYDLALQRRNNRRQEELIAERMRFFTNITHELRTPLTLILGPLEDMKNDPELPASQSRKINIIHKSALRLLDLINTILEFRKTETRNRQFRVQKADLAATVREMGARYSELNTNGRLSVDTEIGEGDFHIWFDPEIVVMIIDNLMSNACKYTSEGTVRLKLYHTKESGVDFTEIAVSDTGLGMDSDTMDHIFGRYYRSRNAESRLGTGIGLSLVYNLVKLHKGEIFVESEPKAGSVFRFRLHTDNDYAGVERRNPVPMKAAEQESPRSEKNVNAEERGALLVVEDNVDIVNYISEIMTDKYEVTHASNGAEGLRLAREIHPDIIICDIMMPEMDGITMIREMKKDEDLSFIPVVVITAKTASEARVEAYEAGADAFISKPFTSRLLVSRIKNLLEARHKLSISMIASAPQHESAITSARNKEETEGTEESPIISKMNEADRAFVENVNRIIIDNISDAGLEVKAVASKMAMSHSTLYRRVKATTGLTVNGLIRKCRAREGARLLETGKYTISEVSYMVGINSQSNFRICFREEFGVNPSEYLVKISNASGNHSAADDHSAAGDDSVAED